MSKQNDLYYLFPGQGKGKHKKHMIIGLIVGILTAALMAGGFYYFSL